MTAMMTVSIPHWFSLNKKWYMLEGTKEVSIPHWFSLNWEEYK